MKKKVPKKAKGDSDSDSESKAKDEKKKAAKRTSSGSFKSIALKERK